MCFLVTSVEWGVGGVGMLSFRSLQLKKKNIPEEKMKSKFI